MIFQTIDNNF